MGVLIRWGLFALVAYFLVVIAYPAYSGAWKLKKATDSIVQRSDGKTRNEIRDELLATPAAVAAGLTKANVDVSGREGDFLVVSSYVASKKVASTVAFEMDFEVRSDSKNLW